MYVYNLINKRDWFCFLFFSAELASCCLLSYLFNYFFLLLVPQFSTSFGKYQVTVRFLSYL
ncbi:hypothetical protein HanPSC8_Chr12g0504301 [Helianthus annuus]|nr:hypothetical protein HanPSC8_Chr12g0504301 [Helianthus annuus]